MAAGNRCGWSPKPTRPTTCHPTWSTLYQRLSAQDDGESQAVGVLGAGLGGVDGDAQVVQAISRALGRLPGVSTPQRSGPLLAAMALDDKWAHLRDGAFVVKTEPTEVQPVAHDHDRERRLWEATAELLERAGTSR